MSTIIGCSTIQREVERILGADRPVRWLPAALHADLHRLKAALVDNLEPDVAVCLYGGSCHPEIDAILAERGVRRLPTRNCIEAFLSAEKFAEMERRRAFVLSPGWLRACQAMFGAAASGEAESTMDFRPFHDVIVFFDFGAEPIDHAALEAFARRTQLPLEIERVDLGPLRARLEELLAPFDVDQDHSEKG